MQEEKLNRIITAFRNQAWHDLHAEYQPYFNTPAVEQEWEVLRGDGAFLLQALFPDGIFQAYLLNILYSFPWEDNPLKELIFYAILKGVIDPIPDGLSTSFASKDLFQLYYKSNYNPTVFATDLYLFQKQCEIQLNYHKVLFLIYLYKFLNNKLKDNFCSLLTYNPEGEDTLYLCSFKITDNKPYTFSIECLSQGTSTHQESIPLITFTKILDVAHEEVLDILMSKDTPSNYEYKEDTWPQVFP